MVKEINSNEFNEVIKTGLVFVDFYADWCYPCKMMMPVVDEISSELKDVSFYKINVDNNEDIAVKFNVQSIPRFLVFKDGILKGTYVGGREKDQLVSEIKKCQM